MRNKEHLELLTRLISFGGNIMCYKEKYDSICTSDKYYLIYTESNNIKKVLLATPSRYDTISKWEIVKNCLDNKFMMVRFISSGVLGTIGNKFGFNYCYQINLNNKKLRAEKIDYKLYDQIRGDILAKGNF